MIGSKTQLLIKDCRNCVSNSKSFTTYTFTVDFTKLWPQMFRTLLRSSEVHIGIHKPICKQSPWLVPEVKEANQMRSLQNWFVNLIMNFWTSQRSSEHLWSKFREIDRKSTLLSGFVQVRKS
jgi:hypothetical protein